jgi:serine/threonine-protein kinase
MPSGAPYLVMEYLDGQDLQQILHREGGRLSVPRAVHFTIQTLRALQTAHQAGIIHRDMKPSNVFVINKDGEPDFVKLVDFGISKVRTDDPEGKQQNANLTKTNSALGTPLYMSPEQARSPRDVDARTDIYSTGAIIYELLSGRTPYTSDTGEFTEILFKIFTTDPEPLRNLRPEVPEGLAAVIHRALTRDLNTRFASANDFAEALTPFADERSSVLVAKMRGGRARSVLPQPPPGSAQAMTPSFAPNQPNYGEEAMANTFLGASPDSLKAAKVPTDVGVTKEASAATTTAGGKSGKAPLAVAIGAMIVLAVGAGSVLVLRAKSTGHASQEPASTIAATAPAPPPPPVATDLAPASASLTPLPTPSASASASAAPSVTANNNHPPPPVNPGGNPGQKPATLGGIKLN